MIQAVVAAQACQLALRFAARRADTRHTFEQEQEIGPLLMRTTRRIFESRRNRWVQTLDLVYDEFGLVFAYWELNGPFGGPQGTGEYEYWVAIRAEDFRRGLGDTSDADLGGLAAAHVDDITAVGLTRWLDSHGIAFTLSTWGPPDVCSPDGPHCPDPS